MEEGWERPPPVHLSLEEAQHLVEPAFPGATVSEAALLTTGLANTNIRFQLQGREQGYVLRLHTREPPAAAREQELMRYLASNARVPIPLAPLVWCPRRRARSPSRLVQCRAQPRGRHRSARAATSRDRSVRRRHPEHCRAQKSNSNPPDKWSAPLRAATHPDLNPSERHRARRNPPRRQLGYRCALQPKDTAALGSYAPSRSARFQVRSTTGQPFAPKLGRRFGV